MSARILKFPNSPAKVGGWGQYRDAGAIFSECGKYRYRLWREWQEAMFSDGGTVIFIMLNPSSAGARTDDPTIRKCVGFAKWWGCNRIEVVNMYAYCATEPKDIFAAQRAGRDTFGPANAAYLEACFEREDQEWRLHEHVHTVAAWGTHGRAMQNDPAFLLEACWKNGNVQALGLNQDGTPKHPLYMPYAGVPSVGGPHYVDELRKMAQEEADEEAADDD